MFKGFGQAQAHKEETAIARRRQREEERKKRIFNAKARKMGVDREVIRQQIAEKEKAKQLERERDAYFQQKRMQDAEISEVLENRRIAERARLNKELANYRQQHQTINQRREWDLNDPNMLQKDQIGRVHDFHGEDLGRNERMKNQKDQMHRWISQQMEEKQSALEREKALQLAHEKREEELNYLAQSLEDQQRSLRAKKVQELKEFNLELSKQRQQIKDQTAQKEEMDRIAEINSALSSDFLNENYEATKNVNDPNRFQPYNFKSLSQSQYQQIQQIRQHQLEEKQRIAQEEKELQEAYDQQTLLHNRIALKADRERQRRRAEISRQLAETHKNQAIQQKAKLKHIDRVYQPKVTDDFFNQFQTTSR